MTIEELVGKSADELEAMTQAELDAWAEPLLKFVRPDKDAINVERIEKKAVIGYNQRDKEARLQRLMDMIPD